MNRCLRAALDSVLALLVLLGAAPACAQSGAFGIPSLDGRLMLPAWWFEAPAAGAPGERRPAVIALHGCAGALDASGKPNPMWMRYAGYFHAEGIHLLLIESLAPRGQKSICETPARRRTIHEEDRREDVYAAMKWLAEQPRVDPARIILVGWSHGAQTVLSAVDAGDAWVQAQMQQSGLRPRLAVAFYPGCSKQLDNRRFALDTPLLMMMGALDDWTPAAACVTLQGRLQGLGQPPPFELEVYPDSYHGFDGPAPVRVRGNVGGTRSGTATVGGNPAAWQASHARLFDFVLSQLQQSPRMSHAQRLQARPAALPRPPANP